MQDGEPKSYKAVSQICEISRMEFDRVYLHLDVKLEEKVSLTLHPTRMNFGEQMTLFYSWVVLF